MIENRDLTLKERDENVFEGAGRVRCRVCSGDEETYDIGWQRCLPTDRSHYKNNQSFPGRKARRRDG